MAVVSIVMGEQRSRRVGFVVGMPLMQTKIVADQPKKLKD